jgi:predicted anti-sigma-YlaC factor YlaD
MKHPSQAALALQAGGDLGFFARWRVERHLTHCESCREELEAFQVTRQILPDLAEIPEIPWNRLAAEMKANIRLGLEAGECVRASDPPLRETRWFTGARAAVALASILVLLVTGAVLERPVPAPIPTAMDEGLVVQATGDGIQIRRGGQALRLMNPSQKVLYSPGAQGSMRARYVDPETGYVTINNVYAE